MALRLPLQISISTVLFRVERNHAGKNVMNAKYIYSIFFYKAWFNEKDQHSSKVRGWKLYSFQEMRVFYRLNVISISVVLAVTMSL